MVWYKTQLQVQWRLSSNMTSHQRPESNEDFQEGSSWPHRQVKCRCDLWRASSDILISSLSLSLSLSSPLYSNYPWVISRDLTEGHSDSSPVPHPLLFPFLFLYLPKLEHFDPNTAINIFALIPPCCHLVCWIPSAGLNSVYLCSETLTRQGDL